MEKLSQEIVQDVIQVIDLLQIKQNARLQARNKKITYFQVDGEKPHILLIQGCKLKLMPPLYERYSESFDFDLNVATRILKVRKVLYNKKTKVETYEPTLLYKF